MFCYSPKKYLIFNVFLKKQHKGGARQLPNSINHVGYVNNSASLYISFDFRKIYCLTLYIYDEIRKGKRVHATALYFRFLLLSSIYHKRIGISVKAVSTAFLSFNFTCQILSNHHLKLYTCTLSKTVTASKFYTE